MFKQKMQNGKIKYGEWYIDPLVGIPSARQGATNRDKSTFYQGWPRQDATQGDTFCHLFVT